MDKSHQNNNINNKIKKIRIKFHKICTTIFQKWNAFRQALDNNPQILTYFNEDQTVLEINEYLDILYDEILSILNTSNNNNFDNNYNNNYNYNNINNNDNNNNDNNDNYIIEEISHSLYSFMSDYFNIDLKDQSEKEIAKILFIIFNELKKGKENYIKQYEINTVGNKYNIDFPILGNNYVIIEKDDEEEDCEEIDV